MIRSGEQDDPPPICLRTAYRAVFLSPHWDDAVFSSGGRIAQLVKEGPVLVVNFFTHCPPGTFKHMNAGEGERSREEESASARLGFESVTLGEKDAVFREPGYSSLSHLFGDFLPKDLERLPRIAGRLKTLLGRIHFDELYLPLGVGWHVDHRLAFYAAQPWWYDPRTLFYEDTPYRLIPHMLVWRLREIGIVEGDRSQPGNWLEFAQAAWAFSRLEPIRKIRWPLRWAAEVASMVFLARRLNEHRPRWRITGLTLVSRTVDITDTFDDKTDAVNCYASQAREFFRDRKGWERFFDRERKTPTERYWNGLADHREVLRVDPAHNKLPLTVAMVTDDFLPAKTGAGIHVQKIAVEMVRRGHRVLVFTGRNRGQEAEELWQGVRIHRVFSLVVGGLTQALPTRGQIRRFISENRVDIIHFHYLSFLMLQAWAVARFLGTPAVYTAHMSVELLTQPSYMKPLKKALVSIYLRLCAHFDDVICVSARQGRQVEQFNLHSRVHIISNPIDFRGDEAPDAARPDRFVVLYAGRLSPEKNIDYLLRGFQGVADRCPEAVLWISGQGPSESHLRRLTATLGLRSKVTFLGHTPHDKMPALYASSNVFVLPSISETQGMVALEAMRFRKPVIVTDQIVAARELVTDGENGFIVDPGSPRDLTDRLILLHGDGALRKRMGEAGFAKSAGVTTDRVGEQLEALYLEKFLAERKRDTHRRAEEDPRATLSRRKTCAFCGAGVFDDRAGQLAVPSTARAFQTEYFALWRCAVCLSIHSLPNVPMEEYYKKNPYDFMRMNPYVRRSFLNLSNLLRSQGVDQRDRVVLCSDYNRLLIPFFQKLGYSSLMSSDHIFTTPGRPPAFPEKVDAIVMSDFLERQAEPLESIQWASDSLRPEGLFFINTVNSEGLTLTPNRWIEFFQPYRIHLPSRRGLENAAHRHGFSTLRIWRHSYLDTLWPFANYRAMNYVSAFLDGTEDSAFDFRPMQMFRKPWRIPWFFCLGLAGGLFPDRSNMFAVFERRA